jgi:hypothetical protein
LRHAHTEKFSGATLRAVRSRAASRLAGWRLSVTTRSTLLFRRTEAAPKIAAHK